MTAPRLCGFPSGQAQRKKDGRSRRHILTDNQSQKGPAHRGRRVLANISQSLPPLSPSVRPHCAETVYLVSQYLKLCRCESDMTALFIRLFKTFLRPLSCRMDLSVLQLSITSICVSFLISSLLPLSPFPLNASHSIQKVGPRLTCIYNVFVSGSPLRSGALLWLVGTADNVGVVWRSWLAVRSETSQSGATTEPLPVPLLQRLNKTLLHKFFKVCFSYLF